MNLRRRSVFVAQACAMLAAWLLAASAARAAVLFDGEWNDFGTRFQRADGQTDWQAGWGASHWLRMEAKRPDAIHREVDPTSPKHGFVARVEVRPGDWFGQGGERAEVYDMLGPDGKHADVTAATGHEFYGVAVRLDPDWQSPGPFPGTQNIWGLFLQLHSPDPFVSPPAIALAAESDFHLQMCTGDLLEGGVLPHYKDAIKLPFTNGDLARGHWVQFMIDVRWALDDTGSIAIYRRDEGQHDFTKVLDLNHVPTLQSKFGVANAGLVHYWRTGFYRSRTAGVTSRLSLGPLVRGTSFDEVAAAAFGSR
jgi:Polysaccharide lyase